MPDENGVPETAGALLVVAEAELEAAGRRRARQQATFDAEATRLADWDARIGALSAVHRFLAASAPDESLSDVVSRVQAELALAEDEVERCQQVAQAARERVRDLEGYLRIAGEYQERSTDG